ncbi:MAG: ISNCY family transposase [Deltaproteobacteria bacterium]
MRRTEMLQEIRKMRFEEMYSGWRQGKLSQDEAAMVLGVCPRTFRRQICRYEENGMEGLNDKRLIQASRRRAPVDEVLRVTDRYRSSYRGWNVKHFYSWYTREGGKRSYTWVKNTLQRQGMVQKLKKKGTHRKKRERNPLPGMMIHQDGSAHEWVPGKRWDLIVTMDDATNEQYNVFFVDEEGTASSFQGVGDVILKKGLFSTIYTDRGSHYWFTPKEGGKVSKTQLTQFGRAMQQLGVTMIPAYSPEARGRSERMFRTHQDRLVKELALQDITTMEAANRYIKKVYLPAYNREFKRKPLEEGTAFIPWIGGHLEDILCEHHERTVTPDNCISFEGITLQIPPDKYRCHYVRARVNVHRYMDGSLAILHGPRKLADYDEKGNLKKKKKDKAA